MTKISGTGNNRGFSLVEVVVTLIIISTAYIAIARGLIGNLHVNKRTEFYSKCILTAQIFFYGSEKKEEEGIRINTVPFKDDLVIQSIDFHDRDRKIILDFKMYDFHDKKQ